MPSWDQQAVGRPRKCNESIMYSKTSTLEFVGTSFYIPDKELYMQDMYITILLKICDICSCAVTAFDVKCQLLCPNKGGFQTVYTD